MGGTRDRELLLPWNGRPIIEATSLKVNNGEWRS